MICTIIHIGGSFRYLHNFRIFRLYVCCIRKRHFIDGCFIVVDTNVQPFCVGMFTGGTMAQLRASDVGRERVKVKVVRLSHHAQGFLFHLRILITTSTTVGGLLPDKI